MNPTQQPDHRHSKRTHLQRCAAAALLLAWPLLVWAEDSGAMPQVLRQLWALAFEIDHPIGRTVNWVIVVLFGLGVLDVLRAALLATRDWLALNRACEAVSKVGQPESAEQWLQALGLPPQGRSLVAERVRSLFKLRTNRGIDITALAQASGDQAGAPAAFARFIAGSLVVVGLVGTVFGLSLAVRDLAPLVSSIDSAKAVTVFAGYMFKTLGAMQTAFSCTLTGLICALSLSLLVFAVQLAQLALHRRLESFSNLELVPAIVPRSSDHATEEFVDHLDKAGETIQDSLDLVERVSTSLETNATQLGNAAGALREAAAASESMRESARLFQDGAARLTGGISTFTEKTEIVFGKVDASLTALKAESAQMAAAANRLADLAQNLGGLANLPQRLQGVLDSAMAQAVTSAQSRQEVLNAKHLASLEDFQRGYVDLVSGVRAEVEASLVRLLDRPQFAAPPAAPGLDTLHFGTLHADDGPRRAPAAAPRNAAGR